MQLTPKSSDLYKKPNHAGLKAMVTPSPGNGHIELNLFINPFEDAFPTEEPEETQSQTKTVTPLKIQKVGIDRYTASKVVGAERDEEEEDMEMDPLNPSREIDYKDYKLVHRNDKKNCPVKVSRCEN